MGLERIVFASKFFIFDPINILFHIKNMKKYFSLIISIGLFIFTINFRVIAVNLC